MVEGADRLADLKRRFLQAYGAEKKKLAQLIKTEESRLREILHEQLEPDSVDWRVAFAEVFKRGGFDIVLANPPYISALEFARSYPAALRSHLNKLYKSAKGAYDIFVLFFERAVQCLVPGGVFCFISPNKYLSAKYAKSLREFLLQKCSLLGIVDISGIPVFDNVAVYPILSLFKKQPRSVSSVWLLHPRVRALPSFDLAEYARSTISSDLLTLLPENIWGFLLSNDVSLLSRLVLGSRPLEDLGEGCNRSDPVNVGAKRPLGFGAVPEVGGVRPSGLVKRGSLAQMVVYQSRPRERTPPCPNLPHRPGPRQPRLSASCPPDWASV